MKTTNQHIRVVIIEDEIHNSRLLEELVGAIRPEWSIEAILESVEESVNWLTNNPHPDVMLVDIQLSDGLSFSIFKELNLDIESKIIFTTAYDEYAIKAFQVNSIDYLLKPIKQDALEQAFQKFEKLHTQNNAIERFSEEEKHYLTSLINNVLEGKKEYRTRFLISGVTSFTKLETKNIAFFYSSNKLTFAVDFDGKEYTLDYNLEQLENEINPTEFYRANRKIIVNIAAVNKVINESGGKLQLFTQPLTNFEITISRLKATDFKLWLGK
jgi:DNA-binding LytR/AlgR family response regulator